MPARVGRTGERCINRCIMHTSSRCRSFPRTQHLANGTDFALRPCRRSGPLLLVSNDTAVTVSLSFPACVSLSRPSLDSRINIQDDFTYASGSNFHSGATVARIRLSRRENHTSARPKVARNFRPAKYRN